MGTTSSTTNKTLRVALTLGAIGAALTGLLAGCVAGAEGTECTSNSDCNGLYTCQPIEGRTHHYCCPTLGPEEPASEASSPNCQPVTASTPAPASSAATDAGAGG